MFDPKKLAWMNGEYIKKIPACEFRDMMVRSAASEGSSSGALGEYAVSLRSDLRSAAEQKAWWDYLAAQIQVRTKFLKDIPAAIKCFVSDDFPFDEKAVEKRLKKPGVKDLLLDLVERFSKVEDWAAPALEAVVKELSQGNGMGPWVHPVRVAVSGRGEGIGLFEMLQLLGRDTTLARLRKAAETLCV
jgi:glutamyl-tRNA synthetase